MNAHPQEVTLQAAGLTARVSALGAELQSLRLSDGRELLWQGDPAWWSGRSPVLFPIVGRAAGDVITTAGVEGQMPQHGFARRSMFELIEHGTDHCRHLLRDTETSRTSYPRAFALEITHRLSATGLEIRARVENRDSRDMPFGLGFHPAFSWPLPGCEGLPHVVQLENGAEPTRQPLQGGLIAPGRLASPFRAGRLDLAPELFADDALIFPEGAGQSLRYGVEGGLQLGFRFENLPFVALWTRPGAPFLCIEPWHGMAAEHGKGPALEDRPGTMILAPGGVAEFSLRATPHDAAFNG